MPNSESESFVTPQEAVIPQTQTTTPPIQTYKKKSKAKISQTPTLRRSARLESGGLSSRKPAIDNTIYEIMDSESDDEATPSPPRTKSISRGVLISHPQTHSFKHTHSYQAMSSLNFILILGYRFQLIG
jgi:hypothetical protein